MAYEGGYTSAVDSAARRQAQEAQTQALLQSIAQQGWQQQQKEQQAELQKKLQIKAFEGMQQMPQMSAPPPQMAPGQPSVPMQPPQQGMAPPPAAAQPPQQSLNMGATAAQPPMPAGWRPSPAAPPGLGGPPVPSPAGAPPAGGAGGLPPTGQIGAPPAGAQPTVLPPTLQTMEQAIKVVDKMKLPEEQRWPVLQAMGEMMDKQNKAKLEQYKIEDEVKTRATAAAKVAREEAEIRLFGGVKPTPEMLNAYFATGDMSKARGMVAREEMRKGEPHRTTVNVGGGAAPGFTPDAVELGAQQYLKTGQLPSLGMGKDAVRVRGQIMERAAQLQKEGGGSSADVPGQVASFKADVSTLRMLKQRSNAIEASAKKIDKDMATLDKYLESGTAGSVTLVNKPLNVLRTQFSDPKLNELAVAAKIVGTEYERMITGGLLSIAQLHEGAREDADKLLNLNMTPAQIRATIKIMKQEIQNQRSSWKDQISEIEAGMKGSKAPATGGLPPGWTVKEH